MNATQFEGRDPIGDPIMEAQFNTISPENALKWQSIDPVARTHTISIRRINTLPLARNNVFIVGHRPVWHSQTPRWASNTLQAPHPRGSVTACTTISGRWSAATRAHQRMGRSQRSAERRRNHAPVTVVSDHRRRRHRSSSSPMRRTNASSITTTISENEAKRKGAVELMRKLKRLEFRSPVWPAGPPKSTARMPRRKRRRSRPLRHWDSR